MFRFCSFVTPGLVCVPGLVFRPCLCVTFFLFVRFCVSLAVFSSVFACPGFDVVVSSVLVCLVFLFRQFVGVFGFVFFRFCVSRFVFVVRFCVCVCRGLCCSHATCERPLFDPVNGLQLCGWILFAEVKYQV